MCELLKNNQGRINLSVKEFENWFKESQKNGLKFANKSPEIVGYLCYQVGWLG